MQAAIKDQARQISDLEEKCRKALQYEVAIKQLNSTARAFDRICALLDFIGDSQQALLSILSQDERKSLDAYFLAYGLLQLLYSRQYSLRDVLKTLNLQIPVSLGPSTLVTARDSIIGHPINNDGAAHIIARHTLTKDGFEYWSYYPTETRRENRVNYDQIIGAHLNAMEAGLRILYEHIADFENDRRRQMRTDPLSPTLHGTDYLVRQVAAALVEPRYGELQSSNSEQLIAALTRFRAGLAKRYGDERTSYDVDHVIEGVRMLRSLYPPQSPESEKQYRIIADGVEMNFARLDTMAHDIDEQEKTELA